MSATSSDPRLKPVGMTERDWKRSIAEREQKRRAAAYPKLIEALKAELVERDAAAADTQHSVRRAYETERAKEIRALLRDLGEAS